MSQVPAERLHEPMKCPGMVNDPDSEIVPPQPDDDHGPVTENIPMLGAPPVSVVPNPVTVTLLAVAVRTIEFTGPIVPLAQLNDGAGDIAYVPVCTVPPQGLRGACVHIVPVSLQLSPVHASMSSHVTGVPAAHVPDPPDSTQCSIPLQRRASSQSASAPQRPWATQPNDTEHVCIVLVSQSESSRTLWHIPPVAQMSCVQAIMSSHSAFVVQLRVAEQRSFRRTGPTDTKTCADRFRR